MKLIVFVAVFVGVAHSLYSPFPGSVNTPRRTFLKSAGSGLYEVTGGGVVSKLDVQTGASTPVGSYSNGDLISQGESIVDEEKGSLIFLGQTSTKTPKVVLFEVSLENAAVVSQFDVPLHPEGLVGVGSSISFGASKDEILVCGTSLANVLNHDILRCSLSQKLCKHVATRDKGFDVLGSVNAYFPEQKVWFLEFGSNSSIYYDGFDINSGERVVHGMVDPTLIEAGFMDGNAFYGIGLQAGPMRTVVKWTVDGNSQAPHSTHTVLGNLPGYFVINSGMATWDSSSRTIFTQLMARNATKAVDLVEVSLSTDDKVSIKHVVKSFCTIGTCPFEMKYLN